MDDKKFVLSIYPNAKCIKLLRYYNVGVDRTDKFGFNNITWYKEALDEDQAWHNSRTSIEIEIFDTLIK